MPFPARDKRFDDLVIALLRRGANQPGEWQVFTSGRLRSYEDCLAFQRACFALRMITRSNLPAVSVSVQWQDPRGRWTKLHIEGRNQGGTLEPRGIGRLKVFSVEHGRAYVAQQRREGKRLYTPGQHWPEPA